jgi:hypothetical protein
MAKCWENNIFLLFLPAHTSHGLQPLDNGVFNVLKAAYRKELSKLAVLTDSAPVQKLAFIKCYAEARNSLTEKTIRNSFKTTGNWPICRQKALSHPEIQDDRPSTPEPAAVDGTTSSPISSAKITSFGAKRSPGHRRKLRKIAMAFDGLQADVAMLKHRIEELEAKEGVEVPRKRCRVPNPNKKFMHIDQILEGKVINDPSDAEGGEDGDGAVVEAEAEESEGADEVPANAGKSSRLGREIRRPARYLL